MTFIDAGLAEEWGIPSTPLENPLVANVIYGNKRASVTKVTSPLTIRIAGKHQVELQLLLIEALLPLGIPDSLATICGLHIEWWGGVPTATPTVSTVSLTPSPILRPQSSPSSSLPIS